MKTNKILILLITILTGTVIFTSCKKDDNYDFNAIIPKLIGGINGPSTTYASGLAPIEYSVIGRAGSSFEWTVTGAEATIVNDDEHYKAYVTFDQSDLDLDAVVTCVETTQGGKSSEPATLDVSLKKFKAMAYEEFIGEWTGEEVDGNGNVFAISLNIEATENENVIKFPVSNTGLPALMEPLFASWGESFQPGFGNEGNIYAFLDLNTGSISLDCDYIGETLPGPYDYWFGGTGSWEGINKTIELSYALHWDGTCSTNYNQSTLSIQKVD